MSCRRGAAGCLLRRPGQPKVRMLTDALRMLGEVWTVRQRHWIAPTARASGMPMETGNVDVVLMRITADECKAATEDLARYLDSGLPATEELLPARELLAAFLNDLSNERLTRWGPQVQGDQHSSTPEQPKTAFRSCCLVGADADRPVPACTSRPVSLDHLRGEPSLAQRSGQRQATKPAPTTRSCARSCLPLLRACSAWVALDRMSEALKTAADQRSASVALGIRSSRTARMIRHGYQTASRTRWVRPNHRYSGASGVDASPPTARNSTTIAIPVASV